MSGETWKDIPGYEGLYQVSDMGRVRSLDRVVEQMSRWGKTVRRLYAGKIMVPTPNHAKKGYLAVHLYSVPSNKRKARTVHRMVAEAFIPNPHNLPEVNHLNSVRGDNRAENLEWTDRRGNMQHAIRQGAVNLRCCMQPVLGISMRDQREAVVFESRAAAEEALSRNRRRTGAVSCCLLGKAKHSYGYVWVAL